MTVTAVTGDARPGLHLARYDWEPALFASQPERGTLLRLKAQWPLTPRRIRFHRNHGIEIALSVLRPYLEYAGISPQFILSDYDDSLSFTGADTADAEVIWLDYTRFAESMGPPALASWLSERVAVLRARTNAPVLVMDWDGPQAAAGEFSERFSELVQDVGAVHLANRRELLEDLDDGYFDPERLSVTGTRMSRHGAVLTARLLGCRWLPALLEPRLKAIVVDLDNTLHDGVLGEDGSDGVLLTEAHANLQRELRRLRDSGLFLGLLSRNEPADVRALFETRIDFPLGWDDFVAHSIGWQSKSLGLEQIAKELRIDTGAILFIDDNPGELLEATQRLPRLRSLHARQDANETVSGLRYFPGLWAFRGTREDTLRIADVRANHERDHALAGAVEDLGSYYRELAVKLTISHNRPDQLARVGELSRKTNQFNLGVRRYADAELRPVFLDPDWQVSTAQLEDRLSDSGLIAIAVSERRGSTLLVHELCISCRALGRQLEDLIVGQLITGGPIFSGIAEVAFEFLDGPRNAPARKWLSRLAGSELPRAQQLAQLNVPAGRLAEASVNPHVTIEVQW